MAKKPGKGTGLRLTLGDLYKMEKRLCIMPDKIYDHSLQIGATQNLIRAGIEAARDELAVRLDQKTRELLDQVLDRQNTIAQAVSTFEKNSLRAWDEIRSVLNRHKHESSDAIQDLRETLLKQIKDESLEVTKAHRALTHFSWEKLAETEDRLIQAQNEATKIAMLVSVAQCILTLAFVGAMLWLR